MQPGQTILVRTNPATQFIAAGAQHVGLTLDLTMPLTGPGGDGYVDPGLGAGHTVRSRCTGIVIASVENLDWEISLWATDAFNGSPTDPALSHLLGRHAFVAANAFQIAGAGLWYYVVNGIDLPYQDNDRTGEIHLMLVNRSASAKSAGAAGAIGIQLAFQNTMGY